MSQIAAQQIWITEFWQSVTVQQTKEITGSLRTHGHQNGEMKATSKCPEIRIINVVSPLVHHIQLFKDNGSTKNSTHQIHFLF